MKKILNSLLIKPAGPDCNLNCTYCFYLEKGAMFPKDNLHRMPVKVLERIIKQAMEQSPPGISFGLAGGRAYIDGAAFLQEGS